MLEQRHSNSDSGCPKAAGESQNSGAGGGLAGHGVLWKSAASGVRARKFSLEIQLTHLKIGGDDERSHEAVRAFTK